MDAEIPQSSPSGLLEQRVDMRVRLEELEFQVQWLAQRVEQVGLITPMVVTSNPPKVLALKSNWDALVMRAENAERAATQWMAAATTTGALETLERERDHAQLRVMRLREALISTEDMLGGLEAALVEVMAGAKSRETIHGLLGACEANVRNRLADVREMLADDKQQTAHSLEVP